MLKTFYLQVRATDNVITDAIEYPYGDYIPYQAESLPLGVTGRWFKLENGVIIEYPELKPPTPTDEITELKSQNAQIILALVEGGLM